MQDNYQQAVLSLLESGKNPEEILSGLKSTLKKHGHEALLLSILRSVERVLAAERYTGTVVTVARQKDIEKFQSSISAELNKLTAVDTPVQKIDDSIIGGFIVEADNKIINKSHKHQLVNLYRKLTR